MRKNENSLDRGVRVLIAAACVAGAFVAGASTLLGIILFGAAGIMLLTAAIGWCPLYAMFGVGTCAVEPASQDRAPARS